MDIQSDERILEEFDDRIEKYPELPDITFLTKRESDEGVDFNEVVERNTKPLQLGRFVTRNSKRE